MKFNWTASRMLALAAVVLVAAVTTIASSQNHGVPEASPGPGWQCSRTMLFATTCSHSAVGQEHRSRRLLAAEQ